MVVTKLDNYFIPFSEFYLNFELLLFYLLNLIFLKSVFFFLKIIIIYQIKCFEFQIIVELKIQTHFFFFYLFICKGKNETANDFHSLPKKKEKKKFTTLNKIRLRWVWVCDFNPRIIKKKKRRRKKRERKKHYRKFQHTLSKDWKKLIMHSSVVNCATLPPENRPWIRFIMLIESSSNVNQCDFMGVQKNSFKLETF